MNATVLVLRHPFFASPQNDGRYVIPRVPDGNYTLVFWLDREVAERRPIEIRGGRPVEADFTH
jgi:hypothetical protein